MTLVEVLRESEANVVKQSASLGPALLLECAAQCARDQCYKPGWQRLVGVVLEDIGHFGPRRDHAFGYLTFPEDKAVSTV